MEWIPKIMPITIDDLKKDQKEIERNGRKGQTGFKHNAQKGSNQNTQKGSNQIAQTGNKENAAKQREQYGHGDKKDGQKENKKDEPTRQSESIYAGDKSHQSTQPDTEGEDKIAWWPS